MEEPTEPPPAPGDGWGAQRALQVLALAFMFPGAVVVGYLAGHWIGGRVGWPAAGGFSGAVVGAAAAFWQLYVVLSRLRG